MNLEDFLKELIPEKVSKNIAITDIKDYKILDLTEEQQKH